MFFRAVLLFLVVSTAELLAFSTGNAQTRTQPMGPAGMGGPFQGTPEEQRACQRDAVKHCREALSDTFRVLACLQANRMQISKGCRRVLESHGQ
jgi:hypothetical protein